MKTVFQALFSRGNTPRSTPNATPRNSAPSSPRGGKGDQPVQASRKNSKSQGESNAPEAARTGASSTDEVISKSESWEVIWQDSVHVRKAADRLSDSLGTKAVGSVVRGSQQGNWLALSEEPGFMLIGDATYQLLQKVRPQGRESQQADAASELWQVIWQDSVHVREAADRSTQSLGIKDQGCVVRGCQQGSWVALSDEPGFMLISDGDCELLRRFVPSKTERWEVVWPDGVHVRSACDRRAQSLGIRERSSTVSGCQVGEWLVLANEPGFMLISMAETGCTLLRKVDDDPDLDAMMAAAEAKRLEVEAKASRLMQLFAGIEAAADSDKSPPQTPPREPGAEDGPQEAARLANVLFPPSPANPLMFSMSVEAPTAPPTLSTALAAKLEALRGGASSGANSNTPSMDGTSFGVTPKEAETPANTFARLHQEQVRTLQDRPSRSESPVVLSPRAASEIRPVLPAPTRAEPGAVSSTAVPASFGRDPAIASRPPASFRAKSGPPCSTNVQSGLGTSFRDRVQETRGRVDRTMQNISDVRSRLGAQEDRLSSLTQCFSPTYQVGSGSRENARERSVGGEEARTRASSQPLRPEVSSLFTSMVEELHNISVLASRGEQASKEVEAARSNLQSLTMETAVTRSLPSASSTARFGASDEVGKLIENLRREISEDMKSLRNDMDSFKEQMRGTSVGALKDGAVGDQALTSDVAVLRGTLAETAAMLKSELCELAGQALQKTEGSSQVSRQELDEAMMQMRRDVADSMTAAVHGLREETSSLTSGLPFERNEEISAKLAELRNRIEKTGNDAKDARRGLDALQDEVSSWVTQQELAKTTEFMSKEFRIMIDMTMQDYLSASRQELAQVSSQLRRELRPLADFGASADSAATRKELTDAMEELRQELAPKVNGKTHASEVNGKQVGELAGVVAELLEDVAQLGAKISPYRDELAEAKRRVESLCEDVGILKDQGRIRSEDARVEQEVLEQVLSALRGEQRQALEGLRQEVFASQTLRKDLACIVEKASKTEALSLPFANGKVGCGEGSITRRELDEVIDNVKHELAQALDWKHQSSQFVSRQELVDLVEPMMDEVAKRLRVESDARQGSQKAGESVETQRILASLAEDVSVLKKRILNEEAAQDKEFVEQKFRILRQELNLKFEEIRAQLPSTSSTEKTSAGELLDTEKDFGNLKNDLNCLKTRQEFLKQELKCLVDTASKSR